MAETSLVNKLKLKAGQRAAVIDAPTGFLETLQPLPEGVELHTELSGESDWLQVFVRDQAELARWLPSILPALKPESRLWLAFPKGSSGMQTDLRRDQGWHLAQQADLKWINLVSVNETWSAFALRPYRPGEPRQSFR